MGKVLFCAEPSIGDPTAQAGPPGAGLERTELSTRAVDKVVDRLYKARLSGKKIRTFVIVTVF